MPEELMYLHHPGALPGIPGESHGPGLYLVDYEARTIRPYEELALDAGPLEVLPVPIEEPIGIAESVSIHEQQEALPTTAVDGMSEEAPPTTSIPNPESVPSLAPIEDTASG